MGMLKNKDGNSINFDQKNDRYKSRTKQSAKEECDINRIIKRALDHGLPVAPEAHFGDVSHISPESFLEMKQTVSDVTGEFERLTSDERRLFGSPEGYLNHVETEHEKAVVEQLKIEQEKQSAETVPSTNKIEENAPASEA